MSFLRAAAICLSILLVGCNSSDSSNDGNKPEPITLVPGGTLAAPVIIDPALTYEISSSSFNNHFIFNAKEGDLVFLKSFMFDPLNGFDLGLNCMSAKFLIGTNGTCGTSVVVRIPSDGDYPVTVRYSDGKTGYFNLAVIPRRMENGALALGRPDNPALLGAVNPTVLYENSFYNSFYYVARRGDRLVMDSQLEGSTYRTSFTYGCGGYLLGVNINFTSVSCGTSVDYTFKQDGNYLIRVGYLKEAIGSSGSSRFMYENPGIMQSLIVPSTENLFRNLMAAEPGVPVLSSALAIQGNGTTINISDGVLVKNDVALPDLFAVADFGDKINIIVESSPTLGGEVLINVTVGAVSEIYTVKTRPDDFETLVFDTEYSSVGVNSFYIDLDIPTAIRFTHKLSGVKVFDLQGVEHFSSDGLSSTSDVSNYTTFEPGAYLVELTVAELGGAVTAAETVVVRIPRPYIN